MKLLRGDESDLASLLLDPFCQSEFPLRCTAAATCGAARPSAGFLDLHSHIISSLCAIRMSPLKESPLEMNPVKEAVREYKIFF